MEKQIRILIIEDDFSLAAMLRDALMSQYSDSLCLVADDGEQGLQYLPKVDPNLVLLDQGLPGALSGVQVCQKIRNSSYSPMIMMITGESSDSQRLHSYECGVDDFLAKPFNLRELKVRIETLFRRETRRIDYASCLESDRLILDPNRMEVFRRAPMPENEKIDLAPREFQLLFLLMKYPDRVWSHDALLRQAWPDDPKSRVLASHISRLRGKLGAEDGKPFIRTIRGVGYQFLG